MSVFHMFWCFILLWYISLNVVFCNKSEPGNVIVRTVSGSVVGRTNRTWTNKQFYSFRGIPFAEPPVGNLRFKAPVSLKPWEGVKDATRDGKICPQPSGDFVGENDENCLFLNVYTKQLQSRKPVIVFFHPGAFYSMTGASYWTGPEYLMDEDIVLVTVNYRLDALGFISTGDSAAVGNYGLKDQVEALRWVQKNIDKFGGNPGKVTITGYSAGSTSTFFHMLSPMSKGLFHSVIAMSAGVTSSWVITKDPLSYAKKLATSFNCSTVSNTVMVECLRNVPAKEINNKFDEMRVLGGIPMAVFGPVIEPDLGNGEERFIIDDPATLIKRKQFHHVPVVTGITELEFVGWSRYVLEDDTIRENLINNFDSLAPSLFGYADESPERAKNITSTFKQFYFRNKPVSKDSIIELGQWYSDFTIIYGEYSTAKLLARYNKKPVYFYKLSYKGRYGHEINANHSFGPVHHDDLIYLFYISRIFPEFNETDPEAFMVKIETSFWKNFATTGNPTPDGSSVNWTPLMIDNEKYLDIDKQLTMKDGLPFPDRMRLWESYFPVN